MKFTAIKDSSIQNPSNVDADIEEFNARMERLKKGL